MAIIEAKNISKQYPARRGTSLLLGRGGLMDALRGTEKTEPYFALRDISLEVDAGESLGIIGRNGSGKSTLLKILAGVTLPSSGTVRVEGRVASLLELGAGFHPMLTGRENVYLNAGLLGMRAAQVDQVFEQIVSFSGIEGFIDQPVDTYSSGMYVRIAFSVAIHTNPDIFLVDEVLAVGDEEFQRKCRAKIGELKEQGKTIVFVSHDLGIVHALCGRVVLLHQGTMINRGTPQSTIDYYLRQIGRESGIHTVSSGGVDLIFNHGRVSLFRGRQEITGSAGISATIYSLGQAHDSTYADWRIEDKDARGCAAAGRMARLPAMLHIAARLNGTEATLEFWLECMEDTQVENLTLRIQVQGAYSRWYLEDLPHDLPEIEPGDVDWSLAVKPAGRVRHALLVDKGGAMPPLEIKFSPEKEYAVIQGYSCGFISGARALECVTLVPAIESPLKKGRHRVGAVSIDLGISEDAARGMAQEWENRRKFQPCGCAAGLENGYITITREGRRITHNIHAHVQVRVGGMWIISHGFQWSGAWHEDGWTHIRGTSARAPGALHWMLRESVEGLAWRVLLECETPAELQEYNVSLGLDAGYTGWKTTNESGEFPDFAADDHEWRHLNKDYDEGKFVSAHGDGLPEIALVADPESPPMRMTALNTGVDHHARVLQALRTPGRQQELSFPPGTHVLFDGVVRIGAGDRSE